MTAFQNAFGEDSSLIYETQFQLLLWANIVAVLGSVLVSPLLATLTGTYGVSYTRIGLLMSLFTAPPVVFIPLAGILADRFGRKTVLLVGLLLYGTGGVALTATTNFKIVLGLRFLQGMGFSGIVPVIIAALGDLYRGKREATAQGLRFASTGVSIAVFPLVASYLGGVSWRFPFVLFGLAFPAIVLISLRLTEPSSTHSDDEPADGHNAPDREPNPEKPGIRAALDVLTHPRMGALVVARSMPNVVWMALLTYNSIIVVRLLSGSSFQAGLLITVTSATFAFSASQAGRATQQFESQRPILLAGNLALAGGSVLVAFSPSYVLTVVGAIIIGAGFGINMSLYRTLITSHAPQEYRGRIVSVGEALGRLAMTVTPIVAGSLITLATGAVGFATATRWTFATLCVSATVLGVILVLVTFRAPKLPHQL